MDTTRIVITVLGGLGGAAWALLVLEHRHRIEVERAARHAVEQERLEAGRARDEHAVELARRDETIRDLGGQLQAAWRGLRRLRVLEGFVRRLALWDALAARFGWM